MRIADVSTARRTVTDLQPLLSCPNLKRVHLEGSDGPEQQEVLDTLLQRGVQVDGLVGDGTPGMGSMLKLAVLDQLSDRELIELPEAYFFDEYKWDDDNFARLMGLEISQELLDSIEELSWIGGHDIEQMVWCQWDGETGEFKMDSLEGHELLRNLRRLSVWPLSKLPAAEVEALRARGVIVEQP